LNDRARAVAGRLVSSRPVGGIELFSTWFAGGAYQKHRDDNIWYRYDPLRRPGLRLPGFRPCEYSRAGGRPLSLL